MVSSRLLFRVPLVLSLFFSAFAVAGEGAPLTYDRISLSVSVQEQVQADRLVAVLAAQREGKDAAKLAVEVNALVDWALAQAQGEAQIESETLGYTTDPLYTKSTLSGWRVRQEIRLRTREGAVLSAVVGRLQERLLLQSIGYQVSDERREEAQEALIRSGIDAFKGRARLIAEQMGQPRYRLVEMQVETDGDRPAPIFRGMAAAAAMSEAGGAAVAPRIEAGKQTIRVHITGTIELQVQ
jgi:predicted secreted protein